MECGIVESLFTIPWDLIGTHPPWRSSGSQSDLFVTQDSGTVVWADVNQDAQGREIARFGCEHCR